MYPVRSMNMKRKKKYDTNGHRSGRLFHGSI